MTDESVGALHVIFKANLLVGNVDFTCMPAFILFYLSFNWNLRDVFAFCTHFNLTINRSADSS